MIDMPKILCYTMHIRKPQYNALMAVIEGMHSYAIYPPEIDITKLIVAALIGLWLLCVVKSYVVYAKGFPFVFLLFVS